MPASNINVQRMVVTSATSSAFVIEEWVDLPEYLMRKEPAMREWNALMKEKFERMQIKMVDFVKAVQSAEGE